MTDLTALVFALSLVRCLAFRSTTPLIKNIQRGGRHFEGPHWSTTENALYWVDIFDQKLYKLDSETNNITSRYIGYGPVSLVVTVKDNPKLLLVAVRAEQYFLYWDAPDGDSGLRLLSVVDLGLPDNRCNDGKVDAKGRLWLGTMGKEEHGAVDPDQGTLYMMDANNYLDPVAKVRPVTISNGIAWTSDNKFMFYIDTPTRNIDVFDFDVVNGCIRNRRTLFSFQANNVTGFPDGMTIDSDGNLWVACFNGWKGNGKLTEPHLVESADTIQKLWQRMEASPLTLDITLPVIKIDSRAGRLLEQHKLPVSKVTSVMWGGHDLSTLFVTTSREGLTQAELNTQPEAGSLYAIEGTGAKGLPENQFVYPDASKY